ncbi:MAG: carboxypeptidase regulatory-like domain-containing protein, partial [Candidatus Aminicenantes bacterium]|nr:carboxypeptidase regulatory-like domain-containing protein [Candidatus Aminicenantes bacterium]
MRHEVGAWRKTMLRGKGIPRRKIFNLGGNLRKTLIFAFAFLLAVAGMAQQRTGNVIITVVDNEGARLPGVTVTLQSPFGAVPPQVTSAEGVARFLSLPPSRDYAIKLELQGFKTKTETGITVNVGISADLTLILEQGA